MAAPADEAAAAILFSSLVISLEAEGEGEEEEDKKKSRASDD